MDWKTAALSIVFFTRRDWTSCWNSKQ